MFGQPPSLARHQQAISIAPACDLIRAHLQRDIADRVRQRLKGKGEIEEKKMMGGLTFMVNGKMCVGILFDKKSEEDKLMVRVGKLNYETLLILPGAKPMDFTGKSTPKYKIKNFGETNFEPRWTFPQKASAAPAPGGETLFLT